MRQLGIDYGTCFIKVFDVKNDELKTLDSSLGGASEERLANVVTYKADGTCVVGRPNFITKKDDDIIISNIKSLLIKKEWGMTLPCGRTINAYDVVCDTMKYLYDKFLLENSDESDYHITLTVPVNFSERQRSIVMRATSEAGFVVDSAISEPFSALLYLMKDEMETKHNVLVFDIGGGTTDLCLAKIENNECIKIVTESTQGISFGGNDVDELIFAYLKTKYPDLASTLEMWSEQENAYNKIKLMAEIMELKQKLFYEGFDEEDERDTIFSPYKGTPIEIILSAKEIEETLINSNIEAKIQGVLDLVYDSAESITVKSTTDIFVTGGSSVIPVFRKCISNYFESANCDVDDLFELDDDADIEMKTFGSVACGAGIFNKMCSDDGEIRCINKIPTTIYCKSEDETEKVARYSSNCSNYKDYQGNIGYLKAAKKDSNGIYVYQSIVIDIDENSIPKEQEVFIGYIPIDEQINDLCEGFRFKFDERQEISVAFGNNEQDKDGYVFVPLYFAKVQIDI